MAQKRLDFAFCDVHRCIEHGCSVGYEDQTTGDPVHARNRKIAKSDKVAPSVGTKQYPNCVF